MLNDHYFKSKELTAGDLAVNDLFLSEYCKTLYRVKNKCGIEMAVYCDILYSEKKCPPYIASYNAKVKLVKIKKIEVEIV